MVVDHRKYTNYRPVMCNKYVAPRFRVRDCIFNYALVAVYTILLDAWLPSRYKKIRETRVFPLLASDKLLKKKKKENKEKERRDGVRVGGVERKISG